MLKSKQVDLSMLFPETIVMEGHPIQPIPVFLSGEQKQAICTSTRIPPTKTVKKVKEEIYQTQLKNYLYIISHLSDPMKLTPSRSKYSIELSQDLDDSAVSILVENGLCNRFPAACNALKAQNTKSKAIIQQCVFEKKKLVDKDLKNDQLLLEDTLAREIGMRILNAYPYVLLFKFHLSNKVLILPQFT